ncbi:MAG TPA: protein kinase [Ktedonobacteraceae bacterium]|nr:protein kinase [Ktedonobacteraceae bacterium]
MTELEGKTLDRYELRRLIGKGGMANVYEAIDKPTGRIVAVKIFKREDEEMLRRFMREAQLMASWRENHLVPIYNYGTGELDNFTHYFIVMPYMEGGTLRARIRRGPLPLVEACHVIQDVASALDYIHKHGVIHRDIKASNVLISGDGNYFLTDFGIARITSAATQLTTTGNVLGTVDYVAPELFELDRKADVRSDLYSLGVLLYEMVTGRLPFIAENQIALVSMHIQRRPPSPRSIIPGIPASVERVMLKALEKKPEQRYGSARDLAEAFCRAVASGTGVSIPDYATVAPPDFVGSTPGSRPDQLILAPPPLSNMPEPGGDRPNVRPSPLAGGTEGIRFSSQNPVPQSQFANVGTPLSPAHSPFPEPPQYPYRPAKRPYYRRPWFSLTVVLLAILIIAGSLAVIFIPRGQVNNNPGASTQTAQNGQTVHVSTATPNLTATAQAALAASATARAQATASAIAGMTATAAAQASATAGVIQTATSGQPDYQDSLKDPNNRQTIAAGWDQSDNCAFQYDGYNDTTTGSFQGCKEANKTYQDAAITVDMRIKSGQSEGVFFRMNNSIFGTYSGYLFEVDAAGRYRILKSGNYSFGTNTLKDWTSANALHRGSVANTLQLIMRGKNLSFYANGVFLVQLSDTSYSTGQVAFLARSDGSTPANIVYSDLNIYPLS